MGKLQLLNLKQITIILCSPKTIKALFLII